MKINFLIVLLILEIKLKSIEKFKFEALTFNGSRIGNKYLTDTEPWKIIKEDKEGLEQY